METLVQDVRYATRLLTRQPGFTAVAVLTIALGVGVSVALFSVIDAAFFHPLPYYHPEQLVTVLVSETLPNGQSSRFAPSLQDIRAWREPSSVLSHIGMGRVHGFVPLIVDVSQPKRLIVASASEDFLSTYGIRPILGRGINADDLREGAAPIALLSHAFWQSEFGGAPQVLGRTIRIDNVPATIVGVLPRGFYSKTAVWQPSVAEHLDHRGSGTPVIARLKPGVTFEQAVAQMQAVLPRDTASAGVVRVELESMYDDETSGYAKTLTPITWAVVFILILACVNVAALLLSRGAARQSELAVRASLGAMRWRLMRQLLTESVVLAITGAAVGVLLAWLTLDALVSLVPLTLPANTPPAINWGALAVALGLSILSALVFGIVPALKLSRREKAISAELARSPRTSTQSLETGRALIAVEVALALVLVTGASLLVRSFWRLSTSSAGFDPSGVITMGIEPLDQTAAARSQYYPTLLDVLQRQPEVSAAGALDAFALKGGGTFGFPQADNGVRLNGIQRIIQPGFFEAFGVRALAGRLPAARDRRESESTVVVNEIAARRLGGSPIGHELELPAFRDIPPHRMRIVGVVPNIRLGDPRRKPESEIYIVLGTTARPTDVAESLAVVLKFRERRSIPAERLSQIASSLSTRVLVDDIQPFSAIFGQQIAQPRHRMLLLSLLGALAMLLTLVGIFSISAYAVTRRTKEIGVRMAFGANHIDVVWRVLHDAAMPIAIGVVAGAAGSYYATRLISTFLFQTSQHDAATFACAAALIAASACVAAWIPAQRAARIDPVVALRVE